MDEKSEVIFNMPPDMKQKVRGCPFCMNADGSSPRLRLRYGPGFEGQPITMGATRVVVWGQVECPNCYSRGARKERDKTPDGLNYDATLTDDWVVRGAIDRWNYRYV